jgi:hypothetical protein
MGESVRMSPRDAVIGIIGRLLLVGGVALLVVIGLYELALIAAAVLIIVFVPDTGTGILTAAGVFFGGQLIGWLVIWIGVTIVRILWWVLFGEGSSVNGTLKRELSLKDAEALKALTPEERLDWMNRRGKFADPRVLLMSFGESTQPDLTLRRKILKH